MTPRRILWIVGLLAVATAIAYSWRCGIIYYPDSASYLVPAENMLHGRGFVDAQGAPEMLRTPGYPLFIDLFLWAPHGIGVLIVAQHLLRLGLILGCTAFLLRFDKVAALTAGLLLAFDIPLLDSATAILSEMFFASLMAVVFWLMWRAQSTGLWAVAGLLAGASVIIRPVSLFFFVPAVALIVVCEKRRLRTVLAFCVAFALLPLAWAARNYDAGNVFSVSVIGGSDALIYKAAGSVAMDHPGSYWANLDPARTELCNELRRAYSIDCSNANLREHGNEFTTLARQVIARHPVGFIKSTALGACLVLFDNGAAMGRLARKEVKRRWSLLITFPVFVLFLVGMWWCWKAQRKLFWLSLFVVAYFVLVASGPEAEARFRVPSDAIYIPLASFGLASIVTYVSALRAQ